MQADELFDKLESACREAGGYLIHSKDALAKRLELAGTDRGEFTAGLKSLEEQGKVVIKHRGRAGLLVALPGVPLPELQKDRVRQTKKRATSPAGSASRKRTTASTLPNGAADTQNPRLSGVSRREARQSSGGNHFCPWCGGPIQLAWNYCSRCGEALETVKDLYVSC